MNKPIIILGAGGHAKVLLSLLQLLKHPVLGILEANPTKIGESLLGVPILGTDDKISDYAPGSIRLVNGIGSVQSEKARQKIFEIFKQKGYTFANVVHPSAIIAPDVVLGEGVQVMAGVILQTGVVVRDNVIINTRASLDHDCLLEEHVHVAPGTILSGGVRVGRLTHLGTGSIVIQNIEIGSNSLIAAGSVVVNNVPNGAKIVGIPGKAVVQ